MSSHRVELGRYAVRHLNELWDYVARKHSAQAANQLILQLVDFCNTLSDFPERGQTRDDIHPGLRIYGYKRRAVIAFTVTGPVVEILGVYYGGRDYEPLLREQVREDT